MYIKSKDGKKLVNLDHYEYLKLDGNDILACKGDKYTILGEYPDEELALAEFSSLVAVLSRKDRFSVIEMG